MKKLELEYLKPQTARAFRFWKIPKELTDNEAYAGLDFGAMFLYGRMLEIAGLSAKNEEQFTDKNGHIFIIYTVEKMMKELDRSRPTIAKFTKQLEEYGLIEKVRQGQGKPSLIFVKDFTSVKDEPENPDSKEDELQEDKDVDFKKSNNFTSGSKETELPEVKNLDPIELNNKDLENKEPENHSFPPTYQPVDLEDGGTEPVESVEEVQGEVRSTTLLTAGNRVLWTRLNAALDCFREMCENDPSPQVQRQYKIIYHRYLSSQNIPPESVMELLSVERSQFYKGIRDAAETLSVILFGADSMDVFS